MEINKLPQEIRQKIKKHMEVINTLNSTKLLEYSKRLNRLKKELGVSVVEYLFDSIQLRTLAINSGIKEQQECEQQKMIKNFLKEA